jgi:hypothetical protein
MTGMNPLNRFFNALPMDHDSVGPSKALPHSDFDVVMASANGGSAVPIISKCLLRAAFH